MGNQVIPMTPMLKGRWPSLMALTGAGFSLLVGLVVILAWHLHLTALIQVPPDSSPICYNTALALLLSGLALTALLRDQSRWTIIPSGLVILIGSGTTQPIVATVPTDVEAEHCELLLRLEDETGNLVAPMAFLPAAERYNLMHKIDRWVIHTLFRYWSSLVAQDQRLSTTSTCIYAINLSGASINDPQFINISVKPHPLVGAEG